MPNIEQRFNKDMLVLSTPIDSALKRQGVDVDYDREFLNLVEPEAIHNALRLEMAVGAQCLVTNTAGITRARLAHINREDDAAQLAEAALKVINSLKPQHVLAEIGSTQLPLDSSSSSSLSQNRDQYSQAVQDFGLAGFDAFFLNGMQSAIDMQCALMGARKMTDMPILASLDITADQTDPQSVTIAAETFEMMAEYGADVVGFRTAASLPHVISLVEAAQKRCTTPIIVQLEVMKNDPSQQVPTEENPYFYPDIMVEAGTQLRQAGVQFLRATGNATSAYTGVLAATTDGFDVICR